jgi:hypothetical protein
LDLRGTVNQPGIGIDNKVARRAVGKDFRHNYLLSAVPSISTWRRLVRNRWISSVAGS